jgi:hypothetical protein
VDCASAAREFEVGVGGQMARRTRPAASLRVEELVPSEACVRSFEASAPISASGRPCSAAPDDAGAPAGCVPL